MSYYIFDVLLQKGEDRNIAQFELNNTAKIDPVSSAWGEIVHRRIHYFLLWIENLGPILVFHVGGNGRLQEIRFCSSSRCNTSASPAFEQSRSYNA